MQKQLSFKSSVSDLCLCRRCPRLFALQIFGRKAWTVGFQGTAFCGSVFHKYIAAPFHRDVAGQKGIEKRSEILEIFQNNARCSETLGKELSDYICRNYLYPFLDKKTFDITQIESLRNCTVGWSDFLVDFFCGNAKFLDTPKTFTEQAFFPSEQILKSEHTAADGTILTVSGKFDCALLDQNGMLLVEFKCRKETDATEELVQLALYAWLLKKNTGVAPRTCVLYLDEPKTTATFSAIEIDVFTSLLPHLFECAIGVLRSLHTGKGTIPKTDNPCLCNECPYKRECDSRFG